MAVRGRVVTGDGDVPLSGTTANAALALPVPSTTANTARPRRWHRAAPESALAVTIAMELLGGWFRQGAAPATLNAFLL